MRRAWSALAVLTLLLGPGCDNGARGVDRVPEGDWGGEHVALRVTPTGATIEFDCAHGSIERPLVLDSAGRFDAAGVFVREHGGPIRPGEPEDSHPASYAGTSDGRKLSFSVTITDEDLTVGPFSAILGAPPRLTKCL